MHHNYMIAISALFLLVFAVMIHSMARHRRTSGQTSARFSGPTGSSQWIWATIPLLILGLVNVALFRGADRQMPTAKPDTQVSAIPSVASALTPGASATTISGHVHDTTRIALAPSPQVLQ